MTAPTTPGRARRSDQRAAAVLTRLRRNGETLTTAELADAAGCAAKTLGETITRLVRAELIIGECELVQRVPKKAPVALWRYYAADAEWPDWLQMPQEAPQTGRHGAICDAKRRGVPASVWELGGGAA